MLLFAAIAGIDGVPVFAYTPEALLGIVVILILTGQLQPKRTVELLLAASAKRDEQLDKLLAQVDTSNRLADALVRHTQAQAKGVPDPAATLLKPEPGEHP